MRARLALLLLLGSLLATAPLAAQAPATAAPPPLEPNPRAPLYQHVGEQYRVYDFPGTGESIPYRLFVPSRWKPGVRLPLLVTLRAGTSVDNSYRSNNDFVKQAEQRGYLVVTPMGYRPLRQPYYGSGYQIARPNAAAPADGWTPVENQRAEQDVMNVIDLVSKEYGVDPGRIYLHGQNPSGSGALHLGAKYPERFAALVISSAPIVFDAYPFDRLKGAVALMVIHGDQDTTNPIEASKRMAEAAKSAGVTTVFAAVPGGTHLEAYLTYASPIFDFLDAHRK
jgi:poly(3-hydroxybutyrate) depolymerase